MPLQGAIVVCDGWGEGDDQLWGSGRDDQLWRGGRGARVRLWCAMVGGKGDDQLWGSGRGAIGGVDVVPLQGGDDQLWGSGRGAIDGCRCSLLWGGGTTNFGGVDVVPLITQKLVFAIWGLCWYNFF